MLPCPRKGASSIVLELVVNDNIQGITILGEPESSNWPELYDQSDIIKMLMSATWLYKKSNIQEILVIVSHRPGKDRCLPRWQEAAAIKAARHQGCSQVCCCFLDAEAPVWATNALVKYPCLNPYISRWRDLK